MTAPANPAVLDARGLSTGYHGQPVVNDVDLAVRPGEMVGLFGPNGAGKTTLLLTLAGDIQPLGGSLEVLGVRPQSLYGSAKRGLALLTDERGIFPPLSLRDNLRLGRGSVDAAIEHFPELTPHLDRPAGELSGGQQQMVALARILAAKPQLILADELSLGLAPIVVRRLLAALRAAADAGAAVLLVEQHVPVALGYVDRACVLVRGRIALERSAAALREQPNVVTDLYLAAAT